MGAGADKLGENRGGRGGRGGESEADKEGHSVVREMKVMIDWLRNTGGGHTFR